jgi:hypothetical protein
MAKFVVFNVFLPRTDALAGNRNQQPRFDKWWADTAEQFGRVYMIANDVSYLTSNDGKELDGGDCQWFRVCVPRDRRAEFIDYIARTTATFGQHSLLLEETGEAEMIAAPPPSLV